MIIIIICLALHVHKSNCYSVIVVVVFLVWFIYDSNMRWVGKTERKRLPGRCRRS